MTTYEAEALVDARTELAKATIGSRIVEVARIGDDGANLTLDNGRVVELRGWGSCCAWAGIDEVTKLTKSDHAITDVSGTDDGETWFIYAGMDQVLGIEASASEGTGYYGFGISVKVREAA